MWTYEEAQTPKSQGVACQDYKSFKTQEEKEVMDEVHFVHNRIIVIERNLMSHQVNLSWTASTDAVSGYNVLRSSVSGGPYTAVNSSPVVGTTFSDVGPFPNLGPFFYVADAVEGTQTSGFSNETPAVFLPPVPPSALQVVSVS